MKMYENISNHDGVNYGQRMQELKKSTTHYSPVGAGSDSSPPHLPGAGKSKFPIMKIVTVGGAIAAGVGCFLFLRHRRTKKDKKKLQNKNMTPRRNAQSKGGPRSGPEAGTSQGKEKKNRPQWMSGVIALVVLAGLGGGVYGVMKLMKK
jgi:hypothetical protein